MFKFKHALAISGLLLGCYSGIASAATIAHTGSYDGPDAHLYQLFGNIGLTSYNTPGEVDAAQMTNDQYWSIQASGGSVSTMVFEISAYSGATTFGVYDRGNAANRVSLWGGSATQGPGNGGQVVMSILSDGSVTKNFSDTGINFAGNSFGYYIQLGDGTVYYSDETLNSNGSDQMAAFRGNGTDTMTIPGYASGTFGVDEYLLAWEDLLTPGGDRDYNDLVILVESVNTSTSVPEPASLALLGMGLIGLGAVRRRRGRQAA